MGRPKGKSKLDCRKVDILKYLSLGISKSDIARLLGCGRATLLRFLAKEGIKGKRGV